MINEKEEFDYTENAINLARIMAKAAGKQPPIDMMQACYILMQVAGLVSNLDLYIEWREQVEQSLADGKAPD